MDLNCVCTAARVLESIWTWPATSHTRTIIKSIIQCDAFKRQLWSTDSEVSYSSSTHPSPLQHFQNNSLFWPQLSQAEYGVCFWKLSASNSFQNQYASPTLQLTSSERASNSLTFSIHPFQVMGLPESNLDTVSTLTRSSFCCQAIHSNTQPSERLCYWYKVMQLNKTSTSPSAGVSIFSSSTFTIFFSWNIKLSCILGEWNSQSSTFTG